MDSELATSWRAAPGMTELMEQTDEPAGPAATMKPTRNRCAIRKASGARRRRRSTGTSRRRKSSTQTPASTAAGSPAPPATTCYNAIDRHVERGPAADQAAIIYDSSCHEHQAASSPMRSFCARVATLAAVLRDFGVEKGDRVILYMPMVAGRRCLRCMPARAIGAIHSVVFGGFAAKGTRDAARRLASRS